MFLCALFCIFVLAEAASESAKFPHDFLFGASTSAYQIEGAWNIDGKGPSIWDDFTHSHPEGIADHQNGDIAANSYEYYEDDIKAIKSLGMDFYRFSISWSRVLPNGDISTVNEKGIAYYNKLINKLLESNIEAMITISHFDLPLKHRSIGGFTNSEIIEHFVGYANLLFERFGDRVKYWITFNEPTIYCMDTGAAAMTNDGVDEYLCGHNILKAHASVYHLYKDSFYNRYRGQVGIALHSFFYYPEANDTNAADRAMQFMLGWFANPIFSAGGNYPSVMIKRIGSNSKSEGRTSSRLPEFSKHWIEKICGSADFLGLNYYSSRFAITLDVPKGPDPSFLRDIGVKEIIKPYWKPSASSFFYLVPQGLGDILRWIKKKYSNPNVFITENGWADSGEIEDNGRIECLHDHLHQAKHVVLNDGVNLKGYSVWSLIDNFEWYSGYTVKFGLYSVNMTSSRRERTPKKSAKFMQQVTSTRRIPDIN